ncbi:conserved hypothetical protein [Frankia canadensis]|uniref:Molybdopterin oxidoreductase n=1 Tax=Frankia canadensis TaxID=1836972 RepID=A0A2I2KXZ0_9ACTN|nr:molybdopterin oxidoreductase [Frankia canadensis]SNQ50531.1 conserved hypothetical protein [Frankia canadensis]SOU57821.1 conserved hypothetical protein [Frankia canadensis]
MFTTPRFLQGIVPFEGRGLEAPFTLGPAFAYTVPAAITAQPLYFRGGNSTDGLICVILQRDGAPMRYFPIGARASVHVPLRVIEDLPPQTRIELLLAAPVGLSGTVVVDVGIVEL